MAKRFKGSALALVLLFVSTFAIMTAGVGSLVAHNAGNVNKTGVEKRTRYAAYGAIQMALQNLNQDRNWDPGDSITDIPMEGDPDIKYTLRVLNNWSGSGPVTASDGTVVPRFMVLLKAVGDYQDMRGGRLSSGLASMGYIGDSYFNYAAMGTQKIVMLNNATTDSYRNSAAGGAAAPSASPWARGNIITNGIGDVLVDGTQDGVEINNSTVKGHCTVGPHAPGGPPAGEPALRLSNGGKVLYERKVNTGIKRVPRYAPPFDPTSATASLTFNTGGLQTLAPGAYRKLTVNNLTNLRLSPGDYFFMDSIEVNNGELSLDASTNRDNPVSLYVGKSITFTNSSRINVDIGKAQNSGGGPAGPMTLRLFWVGTGQPGFKDLRLVMSDSQGAFVAAGKALGVNITNSTVHGSLKGLTISLSNNTTIWYDKDLFNVQKLGYVAWSLQGLTTDAGDVMEDGGGDAGGDAGGDGGGDGGGG